MTSLEIETKALRVLDAISRHQPVEDDLLELKSEWPSDYRKAARQIAGHANAARGQTILWLIGVDEHAGVVGASHEELSTWHSRVTSFFDERLCPALTSLNIPFDDKTIVALLFETDRAPFVIKIEDAGPITREVPWREGNSTRSARRSDLIRLLVPLQKMPIIEVLRGEATLYKRSSQGRPDTIHFSTLLDLYITPSSVDLLVIPFHRCKASVRLSDIGDSTDLRGIHISAPKRLDKSTFQSRTISVTLENTDDEIVISGPGLMHFRGEKSFESIPEVSNGEIQIHCIIQPFPIDEMSISFDAHLQRNTGVSGADLIAKWYLST